MPSCHIVGHLVPMLVHKPFHVSKGRRRETWSMGVECGCSWWPCPGAEEAGPASLLFTVLSWLQFPVCFS